MSELPKILNSEAALEKAENKIAQTKRTKERLKRRRNDGKVIYSNWQNSPEWKQWRMQQLEHQDWNCAICGDKMHLCKVIKLRNGDFILQPKHPTVDHILPKSLFPELTLDPQNLVMVCWSCNKSKGSGMAIASRMRHQKLKQNLNIGGAQNPSAVDP